MAWTTPKTDFAPGNILNAAEMNDIGSNLLAGSAAACRVVRTTNQTGYTSLAAINFESASASGGYQTETMWVVSDPSKITVPYDGIYLVAFRAYLTSAATLTAANGAIAKNADPAVTTTVVATSAASSTVASFVSLTTTIALAANDYLRFGVGPTGGSAYVINGASTEAFNQTSVAVTWLGDTA
jgi:hypothetical protein